MPVAADVESKLYKYCTGLYDQFEKESVLDNELGKIWTGKLVRTAEDVIGVPKGVYKRVVDRLHDLGCIEQLERGYRGNSSTVILLKYPPTPEVWARGISVKPLTRGFDSATIRQTVRDIQESLGGINVKTALAELQAQINDLKREVSELAKNSQQT